MRQTSSLKAINSAMAARHAEPQWLSLAWPRSSSWVLRTVAVTRPCKVTEVGIADAADSLAASVSGSAAVT